MGKLKKIQKKLQKPPLSKIDKFIYAMIIVISFTLMVVLFLCVGKMLNSLLFFDESVVAGENRDSLARFIPIICVITLTPLFIAGYGLSIKQPIIGNKKFKLDILKPTIKTYPLFSKEFKDDLSYKSKKKIKRIAKIIFVIFLICLFIFPLGIFPKTVLDNENNCITYNVFNQITHQGNLEDANEMKIEIVKHYGYRRVRVHYIIEISFIFDNKVYVYYTGNFSAETNEEVLKEMIRLKELFADGRYKIKGSDMMNKLLEDREYTNKETELVYQLFDYKDN